MAVQFLHIADLHLGSQLHTDHRDHAADLEILDTALYTAVERLFDVAVSQAVDFVVIAGDLYDEDSRSVRANQFLADQCKRLHDADIPVYVAYGNHDPVGTATRYVDLPPNVYEFDHAEATEFCYPDETEPRARIWGQSYRDRHENRKMYRGFTPADDRIPNVGVLHTGLDPEGNRYVPVSPAKLERKDGIHYWALGHIHEPRYLDRNQPLVYPGIPQGRQITEPGVGGGCLVTLDANGLQEIAFVPTSPVIWQSVQVDVGSPDIETLDDLERHLIEYCHETDWTAIEPPTEAMTLFDTEWTIDGVVCRWELVGDGPVHEPLTTDEEAIHELTRRLREQLPAQEPIVWTESIRDRTRPPVPPITELAGEDRVVDEFLALEDTFHSEETKAAFRDDAGNAWTVVNDHEEGAPDELSLTDEKLTELIDRATQQVRTELARRRTE